MVMNRRKSPSWLSFIIAHELGHLHHRHLRPGQTLVDEKVDQQSGEKDEREANDFALRLLTGQSDLGLSSTRRLDAKALAEAAEALVPSVGPFSWC
jgi:Zn-dependent peptidase ImmA (M78 family)